MNRAIKALTAPSKFINTYLAFSLFAFISAFFYITSSKSINNIFYLLILTPVVAISISNFKNIVFPWKNNIIVATLTTHVILVTLSYFYFQDISFSYLKQYLYIFSLLICLNLISTNSRILSITWFSYFLVCVAYSSIAIYLWTIDYITLHKFSRIALYGDASNPVHASLMILTGWIGFWFIYGLPRLSNTNKFAYTLALFFVYLFSFLICIIFQSRSAIVGLFASIFALTFLGENRARNFLIFIAIIFALWLSDAYKPLLERGISYRSEIWLDAILHLKNDCSILLGCRNNPDYLYLGQFYHAHSAYISILVKYGIIGSATFSAFALSYFWHGICSRSKWFMVSLIGWGSVLTTSSGLISSPRPLWIYFWVPTLLAIIEINVIYSKRGAQKEQRICST